MATKNRAASKKLSVREASVEDAVVTTNSSESEKSVREGGEKEIFKGEGSAHRRPNDLSRTNDRLKFTFFFSS